MARETEANVKSHDHDSRLRIALGTILGALLAVALWAVISSTHVSLQRRIVGAFFLGTNGCIAAYILATSPVSRRLAKRAQESQFPFDLTPRRTAISHCTSNILDYVSLAERSPPQNVARLINDYYSVFDQSIRSHAGVNERYIGDRVISFFVPRPFFVPVPETIPPPAVRACAAILEPQ